MSGWILIYWLVANSGVSTTHSVQFQDEAACRQAFKAMGDVNRGFGPWMGGVCVKARSEP